VKLYEFGVARSVRCHWVLAEAGIEYELIKVDLTRGEQKSEDFLKINPYGKLPVFVDADEVITESAAICNYIAEKTPEKNLIPLQATISRAHYFQWIFFCMAELDPQLWQIRKHMALYPKAIRSYASVKIAKREYDKAVRVLADYLSDKEHILGNTFTAADIIICYNLLWANSIKLLEDYPTLSKYVDRLKQRPAFPAEKFKNSELDVKFN